MAKFHTKLSRKERDNLIIEFFRSIGTIRGAEEMAQVFEDLVSRQELELLAKRLKIAKLLLHEKTYDEIHREMKASPITIARVSAWLKSSGEGFRLMHERSRRIAETEREPERVSWRSVRRRYPAYYWPQLLLEDIVRNAKKRQRERLLTTLEHLDHKSRLYRDLRLLLRQG